MVKIKQGILNKTLRSVYLRGQKRSIIKQRNVNRTIRMTEFLRNVTRPSIAVNQDSISLNRAHSTAVGQFVKSFR